METWRRTTRHPGYEVSDLGRVRNTNTGRVLKPSITNGYLQVGLGRSHPNNYVHQLVLEAFVGPRPDEAAHARHLNGDREDNRLGNLQWGTVTENRLDTVRHGRHYLAKKESCIRGHKLAPPNLTSTSVRRGRRSCKACDSAKTWIRNHPEDDLQAISDYYYERYLSGFSRRFVTTD